MKALFDSSVLVEAFFQGSVHHLQSLARLAEFTPETGICAAHSLAEVYSALTRMPRGWRVSGEVANIFIADLRQRLRIVSLDENDYVKALAFAAQHNIAGGSVYDTLLAYSALKVDAETIYTWNLRHFVLLGDEVQNVSVHLSLPRSIPLALNPVP